MERQEASEFAQKIADGMCSMAHQASYQKKRVTVCLKNGRTLSCMPTQNHKVTTALLHMDGTVINNASWGYESGKITHNAQNIDVAVAEFDKEVQRLNRLIDVRRLNPLTD